MLEACICIEGEPARVGTIKMRVARKVWKCCECGDPIVPGERYECASGKWEDDWETYRTCEVCTRIRNSLFQCWIYGGMIEAFWEAYGFDYRKVPDEAE